MQPIKTDNKYNNSKIYTIRSYQLDKYYIGSTTQSLHKRLYDHKRDYKLYQNQKYHYITSFELIKFEDCYIELLENFNCDNKEELTKREGEWIRANLNDILNKKIEGRTVKQYRVDNADKLKQYYIDNADKMKQYKKQWQIDNADKIKQNKKQYRIDNADKIKQNNKQYRIDNADKIKQYRVDNANRLKALKKVKFVCECGGKYTNSGKAHHLKTKKHTNYSNSP
jgi:hypothetical protein